MFSIENGEAGEGESQDSRKRGRHLAGTSSHGGLLTQFESPGRAPEGRGGRIWYEIMHSSGGVYNRRGTNADGYLRIDVRWRALSLPQLLSARGRLVHDSRYRGPSNLAPVIEGDKLWQAVLFGGSAGVSS